MKPPKHLVLDEDVHRALRKKKTETGLTVKDLGNCALRSVLKRPLLVEAIGERLVSSGLLEEEQFDAVRAEALQQICLSAADVASIVHPTRRHTVAAGSWEIEELARDEEGTYQVLSAWLRDQRMRPFEMHRHVGIEFLILLKGSVLVSIDIDSQVLMAPSTITVPPYVAHSVTPLERTTHLMAIISPPEPGYGVKASE